MTKRTGDPDGRHFLQDDVERDEDDLERRRFVRNDIEEFEPWWKNPSVLLPIIMIEVSIVLLMMLLSVLYLAYQIVQEGDLRLGIEAVVSFLPT